MNTDIRTLASGLMQGLTLTLFPPCCVLCGSPGFADLDICSGCYRKLPWIGSACSQCALPLAADGALKCGQCQRLPPAFDFSTSLFRYQDDALKLIQQLKFGEKLVNSRLLGTMLAVAVAAQVVELPACIVPVPLFKRRLRQRGFNQSIELARTVGNTLHIPVNRHALIRVRDTVSQTGLDRQQRRRNIRGAFAMAQPLDTTHVAILDDVVTTTSTANELARLLKRSGIGRVDVWSIARAV